MPSPETTRRRVEGERALTAPSISLPRGGGAIRGIGEKFAANPVTGTGSTSLPLAASPGRSGFGPQLSLTYDSGAGNGPFGFGWALSLPAITRKTEKGLPQYRDAEESDVFILSGAEDLVPVLRPNGTRYADDTTAAGYTIQRYRPRTEGLFARIERWTRRSDGDVHWRAISRDNVLTLYGRDANSRIADPADPRRIFSWLICETRDDKGNAVLYEYKPENGAGVDLTRAHERNRGGRDDPRRMANRYLKRICYGNRVPLLDGAGERPRFLTAAQVQSAGWMFEVVLDYGEHGATVPKPDDAGQWACRADPFSSYRAGFEVRTYRLCQRVLMFHHFEHEAGVGKDCLVRSTDFTYSHAQDPAGARSPVYTFLTAVTQTGWKRQGGGYLRRSLPPVEFGYSQPAVQDTVEDVDAGSLENLPVGLDGAAYRWIDLHGEGIPGILTEQGGGWFYKRNLSPIGRGPAAFAPLEPVAARPNPTLAGGQAQPMDLAGDGRPDLVVLDGPEPGLYEHDGKAGWQPFRPFTSRLNRDLSDPNLRFIDLDGDGRADVLLSEDGAFVWHPSLGEAGFGPARRVHQALDEEKGPRLVFADGTQSIYLADLSGDGLTDLVRIRSGEVCYWPNLGYGRFGPKVTMDQAPRFDHPDQFDQRRIRLADIDGTGTTDIIYLHRDGVRLYFNQSGNSWSAPQVLRPFPRVDEQVAITAVDLLGNGTACLVWSSPLPADAARPMRYVNLMGGQKPHLLVKVVNNLGAETRVHYAPSTRFYLADRAAGHPWITRLPFPVHVVERVETYDHVSQSRFVTRYAYHHGYFDGEEREFGGFGMVEQWDTEEFAALTGTGAFPAGDNVSESSHVPPVLTRTWFFTGADPDGQHAGPGLPEGLPAEEEREACRSLRGSMRRQEVYALDGTPRAPHPYTVTEQRFAVRVLQRRGPNRHAVFLTHPREVITWHCERNPADPRVQHALTLEVDEFGNVRQEVAVAYGRQQPDPALPLQADREAQARTLITYSCQGFTNAVDDPDNHHTPLPAETRTYELTGFTPAGGAARFSLDEWTGGGFALLAAAAEIPYEQAADHTTRQKRLIERMRSLYRRNDLTALLPPGQLESLALPGETYSLAFTPGLLAQTYRRGGQPLLASPGNVLGGAGPDRGGYVDLDGDGHWWIPAGRIFLSPNRSDTPAQEQAWARSHFFLPRRYRDPFGQTTTVSYDDYDLLMVETRDPVGNRVTAGERRPDGSLDPTQPGHDYRLLQPRLVTDPNRNRSAVAYDALGMVVGTAVMGKPEEQLGDSLDGFAADLDEAAILGHLQNPGAAPHALLGQATSRLLYDLSAYQRTKDTASPQPPVVCVLARETHAADLAPSQQTRVLQSFSYSDGFGREIQKKHQAEPGPVPQRAAGGQILVGADGRPVMTAHDISPRWVGSGWTVFNNKGKPVRQYEPFFTDTHRMEFDVRIGVSPVLFYDPAERIVATLHPNHTWEKVVFDAWRQETWDVNDTVLVADPGTDPDAGDFFRRLPQAEYRPTWHALRTDPAHAAAFGAGYPDAQGRTHETRAAEKAAVHAGTPAVAWFDALGRTFLTVAHNRFAQSGAVVAEQYPARVELDIEGNQRAVRDAVVQAGDPLGRVVMRFAYDMLGNRIHQASMESGERWMLSDVAGSPIRAWDSRGHAFRSEYDLLRRPLCTYTTGADPAQPQQELLTGRLVYGEQHPEGELRNLRGELYLQLDQAGASTTEAHDFKGNPLRAGRRLATAYKTAVDWSAVQAALPADATAAFDAPGLEAVLAPRLEAETFTTRTAYDALDRPIMLHTADGSIARPAYNEANLLEALDVCLRGAVGGVPQWTPFVTGIDYDARGQRTRIAYGNGAVTTYQYDPASFRLVHLLTRRSGTAFPGDCPQPPPAGWPGCQVQNIYYTYDPVGNVTHIRDAAQQTIFWRNRRVEPSAEYTYDATYRLVEATGREHLGQAGGAPVLHSHDDAPRAGLLHPGDGSAVGRYAERYAYDAVGNLLEMLHRGSDPAHPGWRRRYEYSEASLLEPARQSNRLSRTTAGNGNPADERYAYDAHGNMTRMPHLGGAHPAPNMHWDYRDQLRQVDLGGGGTAYYVYDAAGQRLRKVWEKAANRVEERLYLGAVELYRRRDGAEQLERATLHVMDDQRRIAMVETRTLDTAGTDPAPAQLIRYQFGNHLGSVSLELDEAAQVISYEEYTPYGSTAYQAVRSQVQAPKRYRYTGKERDEETGLYYHGARHYAPWLGRWTAPDPAGLADGPNLYAYVRDNPVMLYDPTGTQSGGGDMSPELRAAWEAAERAGYDDASVERLVEAQDRDFERRGISLWTRQGALERATVRASAAARHWREGNYGRATVHGTAGVIESLGVGMGMFGETPRGTAGRMVLQATLGAVVGRFVRGGGGGRPSAPRPAPAPAPAPAARPAAPAAPPPAPAPAPAARPAAPAAPPPAAPPPPAPRPAAPARPSAPPGTGAAGSLAESQLRVRIVSALERAVVRQNQRLANAIASRDTAFLQRLGLSQAQINILLNRQGSRPFAAIYGQAMERMVNRAIRSDPLLSQHFQYIGNRAGAAVAGPGRPDWMGRGVMQGILVDLTSVAGRAAHYARYYGEKMLVLTYTRP